MMPNNWLTKQKFQMKLTLILLIVLAVAILQKMRVENQYQDKVIKAEPVGGDFLLTSKDGPFRLSSLTGNFVLIYFGFTHCADFCPTMLSKVSSVFKLLTPEELEQTKLLFITVDPERDSLEVLTEYTKFFHKDIIALTGSIEQLTEITDRYGVFFRRKDIDSALKYTMDHSTGLIFVNQNGQYLTQAMQSISQEDLLLLIRDQLRAKKNEK
jgi:protein SCO1